MRALIAVLLATTSMFFSPTAHTSWAVLSALIVLQNGTSRMDMSVRALHRVVGTSLGLISALAIMTLGLEPWTKLVIIFACLLGMNLTAKRNYAVAVFFITTYSMQMLPPTAHYSTSLLFADRLLETLVGATTALLAILAGGPPCPGFVGAAPISCGFAGYYGCSRRRRSRRGGYFAGLCAPTQPSF